MWREKKSFVLRVFVCIAIKEQETNLNNSVLYSYITLFPTVTSILYRVTLIKNSDRTNIIL